MNDTDSESVPSGMEGITQNIVNSLLPSRQMYEQTYAKLEDWCKGKSIKNSSNEKVLLPYFEHL